MEGTMPLVFPSSSDPGPEEDPPSDRIWSCYPFIENISFRMSLHHPTILEFDRSKTI